jgi:hypothetical protein
MKKKLNIWIANLVLAIMNSALLNGVVLAGDTEDTSLGKGRMSAIKLSIT